jgi:hypothetical protein
MISVSAGRTNERMHALIAPNREDTLRAVYLVQPPS